MNAPQSTRNPWPIAIIAYFVVFIAFIVTFIVFAVRQKMDLVRKDYYDDEVRYQQQLDRLLRTRPLATQVTIAHDNARQMLTIRLPKTHAGPQTTGQIRLYRPSDASLDRDLKLAVDADGVQEVDTKKLRAGSWKVRVYWKAQNQEYFFDQSILVGGRLSITPLGRQHSAIELDNGREQPTVLPTLLPKKDRGGDKKTVLLPTLSSLAGQFWCAPLAGCSRG